MDVHNALAVATPLDGDLVDRIRVRAGDQAVVYDASLVPAPLYRGDHRGDPAFVRDAAQTERWKALLANAGVVLGIPGESPAGLRALVADAPNLRWVQSMYAGAGETVRLAALPRAVLERVTVTTTAGVHGSMLAEFAFFGILSLRKQAKQLEAVRAARSFDRFPLGELHGSTLAVVGLGHIGVSIARLGRAFGMRTIGVAKRGRAPREHDAFDEISTTSELAHVCGACDVVALALPGTPATDRILGAREIAALQENAIVVNVGRGTTIDQPALVAALQAHRIAGAVLDVFDPEPLPPDDPLWTLDNAIVSPHTATLSVHENERIVDLFLDNLDRVTRGEPLRNRVNVDEFY